MHSHMLNVKIMITIIIIITVLIIIATITKQQQQNNHHHLFEVSDSVTQNTRKNKCFVCRMMWHEICSIFLPQLLLTGASQRSPFKLIFLVKHWSFHYQLSLDVTWWLVKTCILLLLTWSFGTCSCSGTLPTAALPNNRSHSQGSITLQEFAPVQLNLLSPQRST